MAIWIIIAVTMLFIIGPIMMLRPSPRERRLARIHQQAAGHQVKIQPLLLRQNPLYSATLERNPHLAMFEWARYEYVAAEGQSGPGINGRWVQRKTRDGQLVWESADIRQLTTPAVDALLQQWQARQSGEFLALELGPRSAALVWNEKGDIAEVDAICQQLQALMAG